MATLSFTTEASMDSLLGSQILGTYIWIGSRMVELTHIVRRAHLDSGLSTADWNDLLPLEREAKLAAAIYEMRAEQPVTVHPR